MKAITVNSSGLFVAVGDITSTGYPAYATSSNGSTWTIPAVMGGATSTASMLAITVNSSGLFVAVSGGSAPKYASSSNGSTWTTPASFTSRSSPYTEYITPLFIAVSPSGVFLVVGYGIGQCYVTSTDGVTWTLPTDFPPATGTYATGSAQSVSYGSNKFMVAGIGTSNYFTFTTSTDNGTTWSTVNTSSTQVARANSMVGTPQNKFVAVISGTTNVAFTRYGIFP
jgi:photosystem II stability/assembly factor-like uncharacterized protein